MKKIIWGEDPEFSGPRDWFRNTLIIREIKRKKTTGKVLDFGCGSGDLLLRLAKSRFYGQGIDASALAVKYSRSKIKEQRLESFIQVRKGNQKDLFHLNEKFDVVVCGETLEHLPDDQLAVKGFFRVLKKRGVCIVTVPAHQYRWKKMDDYAGHFRRYEKYELERLFINAGFKTNKIFYWGFPLSFLWDNLVLSTLINKKVRERKVYTGSGGVIARLLSYAWLKRTLSIPFWIDQLFNWSELGTGLVLVATK